MGLQEAARADEDADAAWSANADRGHFPPRLRIPSWWRRTTFSSSRSPPPRARARTTPRRSRWSTISTTRTLNRFGGDREHGRPGRTRISLPHMRWTREHSARSAQAIGSTALHPPEGAVMRGCAQHSSHGGRVVVHQKATATHSKSDSDAPRARAWSPCRIDLTAGALAEPVSVGVGPRLRRGMERGSSPPKLGRAEALSFFSAEEVARAHPRAALGLLDAAAAIVGRRPGKGGRRQHRPHGRGPARAGWVRPCAAGLVGSARRGCVRVRRTPAFVPGTCRARTFVQPLLAAAGRGARGGAAPSRGAGWCPHPRRARPGHEPAHPEGERVRVRARANTAGRGFRHPARAGLAGGSAARGRPRVRSPARAARAARNPARDGRRSYRNSRCLGTTRDTRRRPAPSPARAPHRARDRSRLATGVDGHLPSLGVRRRPLLARAHRRPGRLYSRLPPTRPTNLTDLDPPRLLYLL